MINLFGALALDASVQEVKTAVESIPTVDTSALATAANQLPDGHAVAVNNLPTEYPLSAAQVVTLTPPAAISGFATAAKQLADGHGVTITNPTDVSALATSAKQLPDNHQVSVSNFPATQPVSGTVTVANPTADPETGLATEATLQASLKQYQIIDVEEVAPITYLGHAKLDGTYLIYEIDETSGLTKRAANIGNNATRTTYALAWTNRATLTYDYIFNMSNL